MYIFVLILHSCFDQMHNVTNRVWIIIFLLDAHALLLHNYDPYIINT